MVNEGKTDKVFVVKSSGTAVKPLVPTLKSCKKWAKIRSFKLNFRENRWSDQAGTCGKMTLGPWGTFGICRVRPWDRSLRICQVKSVKVRSCNLVPRTGVAFVIGPAFAQFLSYRGVPYQNGKRRVRGRCSPSFKKIAQTVPEPSSINRFVLVKSVWV